MDIVIVVLNHLAEAVCNKKKNVHYENIAVLCRFVWMYTRKQLSFHPVLPIIDISSVNITWRFIVRNRFRLCYHRSSVM